MKNKFDGFLKKSKADYYLSEWKTLKVRGKRLFIISELKRDAIIGFVLAIIMHTSIKKGVSINNYFTLEFLVRAIIYTGIYSLGSAISSHVKWNTVKRKYSYYKRKGLI